MPGYGIPEADRGTGLLAWSWASARLAEAHTYWLATTRSDGRPHAMPVWGIWLDDCFYFSTGAESRKAHNLAALPACVVGTDSPTDALVLEGTARLVTDAATLARFAATYGPKYAQEMAGFAEPVYAVEPTVAFAFLTGPGEFAGSATRWVFGPAESPGDAEVG
ncbi:MAG TPA: pyridoxamine 5'-phosphate oxidase family protein [Chloroflexia bacterium]|nr:pyridoxamine 5'-phosphate oxidase family protein [Chloroflexia bacterium]